ncbi:MAG TPA: hypothetical protein VLG74_12300 [Blastocatellia bacterium]|nr:hypothetical protein [Blastocatellia bacterium]
MLRKSLAMIVAAVLLHMLVQPASAGSKAEKQAKLAAQVKQKLSNFGVGDNARLAVKLRNKAILGGYLESAGEQSFVLKNLKTGESTTIAYTEVTQARGHNLSTGAKIAIGIAIGVAAVLIVLAIWINCCTG